MEKHRAVEAVSHKFFDGHGVVSACGAVPLAAGQILGLGGDDEGIRRSRGRTLLVDRRDQTGESFIDPFPC